MTKKLSVIILVGLLLGLVWLIWTHDTRNETSWATTPYIYSQTEVASYLSEHGVDVEVVRDVRRNWDGTALYVYLFDGSANRYPVLEIRTNGLTRLNPPGRGAIPGRNGSFILWFSDDGVHFQNGFLLKLPEFGLFDVDPGGTYFVVGEKPNITWLGRVSSPENRTMIANDFLARGVFVSNGRIYVTGHKVVRNLREDFELRTTCLILREDGEDFEIDDRLSFDWASGVVDVDPSGARLLLCNRAIISHSVYAYDLTTMRRRKVGPVEGFQFFLTTDLLE